MEQTQATGAECGSNLGTSCPRAVFWFVIVLVASALTALSGLGSDLPLDAHEVFVARTAEEMHQRGDLLVPYFNDAPRLKKPPLEYWLVLSVNWLTGNDGIVTEFEARFPSAVAGVAMTAFAVAIGWLLVGPGVGLLAGAMLLTCSGYISYTHSARPEMMYAALCAAGLTGFVLAERWELGGARGRRVLCVAAFGWVCFGLATLTKGPQLVVPMIGGWLIGAWRAGTLRASVRSIRPAIGVPVYAIVGFWWFAVVLAVVPDAWSILRVETIDRIASQGKPWYSLLNPYYLYVPAVMLVPWVFFIPGSIAGPWLRRFRTPAGAMRVWWVVAVVGLALSLSRGRRWYYMLPVLAPMVVLLATTASQLVPAMWKGRSTWRWALLLGVHAVGAGVFAFLTLDRHSGVHGDPPEWMVGVLACSVGVSFAMLVVGRVRRAIGPIGSALQVAVLMSVGLSMGGMRAGFWRSNRFDERGFALRVRETIGEEGVLLGWRDPFEEQIYYLRRSIEIFTDADVLAEAIRARGSVWVLVDATNQALSLPDDLSATRVLTGDNGDEVGQFELWAVRASE